MPSEIVRWNDVPEQNVVFTNDVNTTGGFNLEQYAGAMIHVVSVSGGGAATLTWKVKSRESVATVYDLADSSDEVKETTVQGLRAYALPDEAFAAGYVLAITDGPTVTCRIRVKA